MAWIGWKLGKNRLRGSLCAQNFGRNDVLKKENYPKRPERLVKRGKYSFYWVKKEKGSEKLPKSCTLVSLKAEVIDDKINKDVATCFCSDVSRFEWEKPGGKHERKRDR